jgi:hypothetical protein
VKSGFFFASKRNKIFASISNFASEAKVRAHPTPDSDLAVTPVSINDPNLPSLQQFSSGKLTKDDQKESLDKQIPKLETKL